MPVSEAACPDHPGNLYFVQFVYCFIKNSFDNEGVPIKWLKINWKCMLPGGGGRCFLPRGVPFFSSDTRTWIHRLFDHHAQKPSELISFSAIMLKAIWFHRLFGHHALKSYEYIGWAWWSKTLWTRMLFEGQHVSFLLYLWKMKPGAPLHSLLQSGHCEKERAKGTQTLNTTWARLKIGNPAGGGGLPPRRGFPYFETRSHCDVHFLRLPGIPPSSIFPRGSYMFLCVSFVFLRLLRGISQGKGYYNILILGGTLITLQQNKLLPGFNNWCLPF